MKLPMLLCIHTHAHIHAHIFTYLHNCSLYPKKQTKEKTNFTEYVYVWISEFSNNSECLQITEIYCTNLIWSLDQFNAFQNKQTKTGHCWMWLFYNWIAFKQFIHQRNHYKVGQKVVNFHRHISLISVPAFISQNYVRRMKYM